MESLVWKDFAPCFQILCKISEHLKIWKFDFMFFDWYSHSLFAFLQFDSAHSELFQLYSYIYKVSL